MALNTPMKIVLTVVVIFLIGIGFFLLDYQKKLTDIKQLDDTLTAKREQLKTNEQRVRALPEQLKKKEKLEAELNALIQQKLPKEDAAIFVPKFIQEMENLMAYEKKVTGDDTLQVNSITPGKLVMPGAEETGKGRKSSAAAAEGPAIKALMIFPKQPFQVSFNARYPTVIHFLHQLAALRLQRLVTITRIDLSVKSKKGMYGQSPSLQVRMPMIAYLNEEKTEVAPGTEEPEPAAEPEDKKKPKRGGKKSKK